MLQIENPNNKASSDLNIHHNMPGQELIHQEEDMLDRITMHQIQASDPVNVLVDKNERSPHTPLVIV